VEIARLAGVEFEFGTAVEKILVDGYEAKGVVLDDGRCLNADFVVANADLPYVYQELLPQDRVSRAMARKRFSCSTISFFWGIDKPLKSLPPHTLFLVDDYRQNFESIIEDLTLPENPSLYVHAPARLDPTMAPTGEDTLIGITPVGHLDDEGEQDWKAIRQRARQSIFNRLVDIGIPDLQEHIKFEVNYTPLSWRKRYNLMKGATHGLCHTLTQLGYLRLRNRHARYQNLYFVGASTHPGTGVPTALVSARLAATRLLEEAAIPVQRLQWPGAFFQPDLPALNRI
jgi:phytoene desaturase